MRDRLDSSVRKLQLRVRRKTPDLPRFREVHTSARVGDVNVLRLIPLLLALAFPAGAPEGRAAPADTCDRLDHIPLSIDPDLGLKAVNHWLVFHPEAEGACSC